jgi:hypothetical protein
MRQHGAVRPPKRRVPPGQAPPPPARWDDAPEVPVGPITHARQELRAWRTGSAESPGWMRAVVWMIVASFLVPLVLGALYALSS